MPAKKILSSSVHEMSHEEQVELLSEALLREYMHRRKFTETLKIFDEENPRDSNTISSRALMSELMALNLETQQAMKLEGVETIMEMLCYLRVQRRIEIEELKQKASIKIPDTPEKPKKSTKEKKKVWTKLSSDESTSDKEMKKSRNIKNKKLNLSFSSSNSNSTSSESEAGSEEKLMKSTNDKIGFHLGIEVARSIMQLLCVTKIIPVSFLEQGFVFHEKVEYGLVQWKRGPDCIISVVQTFICAFFFRGGFLDVKLQQQQCLLRALMTLLLSVQSNPRRICLLDGLIRSDMAEKDISNLRVLRNFSSMHEVEDSLHSILENWMEPKGSGVLCFLISLLLSRGIKAIISNNIGHSKNSLINREGKPSSGLIKFIQELLRGEKDGVKSDDVLSELALVPATDLMACGYLSSHTDDNNSNNNNNNEIDGAKMPRHPVWMLHHNDRFVTLFLKNDTRRQFEQGKRMGSSVTFDVFYYDPATATTEKGEIFFTISTYNFSDGRQRREGESSVLHDLIRTIPIWRDGEIDWNGFKPLL